MLSKVSTPTTYEAIPRYWTLEWEGFVGDQMADGNQLFFVADNLKLVSDQSQSAIQTATVAGYEGAVGGHALGDTHTCLATHGLFLWQVAA